MRHVSVQAFRYFSSALLLTFSLAATLCSLARPVQAQSPRDAVKVQSDKAHQELDREAGEDLEENEEAPAPKPAVKPEPAAAPAPKETRKMDAGTPVTVYWHMADDADIYLNGQPLRDYSPSFKTRGDEAPHPAFSTSTVLRNGDVFTVGGRRGGSYGFMLIATDSSGRVVFMSDRQAWKVYAPGDRPDWFQPSAPKASKTGSVSVQADPWYPQKELNGRHGNKALSIWGSPSETFAYLYGIVILDAAAVQKE